jgi:hemoglobin
MNETPYDLLGQEGIRALAEAFYDAMEELPEAATIRAMHEANLQPIKRLLAAYLTGWMGGPPVYQVMKGTVCLTEPHEPFAIGPDERDQWLHCMDVALERIGASKALKEMLREPLFRVADTVRNQDHSGPKPQKPRDPNIIAVG